MSFLNKIRFIEKENSFNHIHQISEEYLKAFHKTYTPVFILNTGRSGSAFMKIIFDKIDAIDAYHEAAPNLFLLSNFAFQNQSENETLKKIFEAARMELLLNSSIQNKIYLESNQCLVFYVNQIKQVFPNAKFIHLTRHPGDFVRSAIMKGWHKNDSVWEKGRIQSNENNKWNSYSHIEKLAWVWKETHGLIEKFKLANNHNFITVKLEDLVSDNEKFEKVLDFIGVKNNLSKNKIDDLLKSKINKVSITNKEPKNMFKLNSYPKYDAWSLEDKQQLKEIVVELSKKYKYNL